MAIRLRPDDSVAHANLSAALFNQADHAGAVASFEEALRLDPENQFAADNLRNARARLSPPRCARAAHANTGCRVLPMLERGGSTKW